MCCFFHSDFAFAAFEGKVKEPLIEPQGDVILITQGLKLSDRTEKVTFYDQSFLGEGCAFNKQAAPIYGATGGFMLGKDPIICGGFSPESKVQTDCKLAFGLDPDPIGLIEPRAFAASLVKKASELWITGGINSHFTPLKSTELLDATNKIISKGPELPIPLQLHCLVKLNDDQVVFIGGKTTNGTVNSTFLYDFTNAQWIRGPDLQVPRFGQFCTLIQTHLGFLILVVGGKNRHEKTLMTMEWLRLDHDHEWKSGEICNFSISI